MTLKGAKRTGWNEECNQALMAIEQYLTEPPIFTSPRVGDTVTPRPGRVYSTTTVGAYKSSKCHIVVFWRLK